LKVTTPTLSEAELEVAVETSLRSKGVNTWQLNVTHQMQDECVVAGSSAYVASSSLASAKCSMPSRPTSDGSSSGPKSEAPSSYHSQSATYAQSPISRAQISKVMQRNKK